MDFVRFGRYTTLLESSHLQFGFLPAGPPLALMQGHFQKRRRASSALRCRSQSCATNRAAAAEEHQLWNFAKLDGEGVHR